MPTLIAGNIPHDSCPDCKAALIKVAIAAHGVRDERVLFACGAQWEYSAGLNKNYPHAPCPNTPEEQTKKKQVEEGLVAILKEAKKYPEVAKYTGAISSMESALAVIQMAKRGKITKPCMYLG